MVGTKLDLSSGQSPDGHGDLPCRASIVFIFRLTCARPQERRQERFRAPPHQGPGPVAAPEDVQQPKLAAVSGARALSAHPVAGAVLRVPLLLVPAGRTARRRRATGTAAAAVRRHRGERRRRQQPPRVRHIPGQRERLRHDPLELQHVRHMAAAP